MKDVFIFKIGIKGLENKIWREIEIPSRRTVADLAYTILASFNSLAYHLFKIHYNKKLYICHSYDSDIFTDIVQVNAIITKLSEMNLEVGDEFIMGYDMGSPTTFNITYLGSKKMHNYKEQELYPIVVDGEGLGMLDDISEWDLKDIVDDTDKLGYSTHYFTLGYELNKKYDYRKYNIKKDNRELKGKILAIKNGYEVGE